MRTLVFTSLILAVLGNHLAQADIFRWEYIDPTNPSLGKQQSTVLAPDGAGLIPEPGLDAASLNLTQAYLIDFDLTAASFREAILSIADLSRANLTNANFRDATLLGADLTEAVVTDASFYSATDSGFTAAQLYSTGSYQSGDLTGIYLGSNDLSGWDFSGKNLTDADFRRATLTDANLA